MKTFLLIADIGGYTRFMKVHRINLAHAQYIVAQLLEAVIDGAGRRLKLSKLEGDAAFFYGEAKSKDDYAKFVTDIRASFLARRTELAMERVCSCDGCTQAQDLDLKFVAHEGEVAFQKIKGHTELAGVDVILVHRLLKNDVPVREYMLMSEPVHQRLDDKLQGHAQEIHHDLEGLGPTRGFYIDLVAVDVPMPPAGEPGFFRKFLAWFKMTVNSLPYMLGMRKACEGFRNLGEIGALPQHIALTSGPESTDDPSKKTPSIAPTTAMLYASKFPPPPALPSDPDKDSTSSAR